MSRLIWNAPERRFFETGLDRGVIYPKGVAPLGDILDTNLITDPAPTEYRSTAIFTDRWMGTGGVGTHTIVQGDRPDGTSGPFARRTWTTGSSSSGDTGFTIKPNGGSLPVVEGDVVRVGAWMRSTKSLPSGYGSIYYSDARGSSVNFNNPVAPNTWVWLEVSHVVPAGKTSVVNVPLDTMPVSNWQAGDTLDMYGVKIAKNTKTLGPYFNGDTVDTKVETYEWLGTANNSLSIKREVETLAVAWEGLTSVEESGGDGAKAYYVDGRPFLFLPVPKEYKATISAYTYPDEFSEIMGIAEVTDGMYLDSQRSQAFDLCYRTLVGNGTQGSDHGYKIHLVYNATVTPQSMTYESLSNSINPSTMSWEIQAVPVQVEGFRPTAHIIIDTRHMDATKISNLEEMLYGSENDISHLPDPQTIFDILHYGDMIIVTDNGDGTFEVEGSYSNVYMVGVGEFRVDNVDGTNNGDGTFTISTTEV